MRPRLRFKISVGSGFRVFILGPPEGTLTLHFIPIVISDDDDEWENEEELNEMCDWMDEQKCLHPDYY